MKELNLIQTTLSAQKKREVKNAQGRVMYTYRNCEDILEALKKPLEKTKCTITITDDVVMIGNRIYIKATATITNEAGESVSASAFAREPEALGNMTQPQVTGSTSSYARKYALNGLLAIDDCNDADAVQAQQQAQQQAGMNQGTAQAGDLDAKTEIEQVIKPMVIQANSIEELTNIFNAYPQYKEKPEYKSIFTARRKQIAPK